MQGQPVVALVPSDAPGLSRGPRLSTLGCRGLAVCPIALEGVRVPMSHVLGPFSSDATLTTWRRTEDLVLAAYAVGVARRSFEAAKSHASEHHRGGKPVMGYQGVRFRLAELLTLLQTAELTCRRAAWLVVDEAGPEGWDADTVVRCAKVFAAEAAEALSRGANPLREHAANALARTRGPDASAFFALIRLFDDGLEAHLPTHTYRHEPGIIATNWGVKADSGFVLSTDIISSNRRSRVWQGAAPARTSLIRQGVWETLSEANLLNTITASGAVPRTSFSVFEDAGYSPDALITLTPETETDVLSALAITPDERKLLQAALADGSYVVLLPGQDHERFSWWRLDPATFSAIGYLPNGRGATSVEYVIKLTLVVSYLMMGVLFLGATLKCLKHYANEALMCTGADIHWSNIVLTKNHKTRTEQDFSGCVLSQARFQPLPELECACGGIGEPVCP
jgi:hypothetical protein